ncbi:hypothetical protein [Sphingobacterium spiritivorum]|uniref:hypothetical protein n=1 Tax=Sphingobacterium spiritivorum TaxID=258 RepID=UPI00191A4813|nr:hypothetical protein [Sphingobacterium spiritivorum]QQT25059.1 hypothetical protein I6J02_15180 [Sphingobacterium spiritivorum]
MPAYKTQDDLGDCKAFSLAAILQQYVNTKWKTDIPDPRNPPADSAISYFGLMAYTNQIPDQPNTLQPNQNIGKGMHEIINDLSNSGNQLILEDCKPFENLTKEFSLNGKNGLVKRDQFLSYLKNVYERLKSISEVDCMEEVITLNGFVDLNFNQSTLKKALTKNNFDQFLYVLFFNDCKFLDFPTGFSAAAFPLDSMDVTPDEVKKQIIKGLKYGKPVLLSSLCISQNKGNDCKMSHSLVLSGYKQAKKEHETKDVFKVHNSWGLEWQLQNNDGWVDADAITNNACRTNSARGYRIDSGCVMWLD